MPIGQLQFITAPRGYAWLATIGSDSYAIVRPTSTSSISLAQPDYICIYLGSFSPLAQVGTGFSTYEAAVSAAQSHFAALAG
jgi:hypothetical protein